LLWKSEGNDHSKLENTGQKVGIVYTGIMVCKKTVFHGVYVTMIRVQSSSGSACEANLNRKAIFKRYHCYTDCSSNLKVKPIVLSNRLLFCGELVLDA